MKLDDVLMLARAGYSKADIAALLGSNPAPAPTTPKAAPLTGAPPCPVTLQQMLLLLQVRLPPRLYRTGALWPRASPL